MSRRVSFAQPAFVVVAVAVVLAVIGWREFEFLTDDAFIAFRYVHNAVVGRGLVWNPPPFLPVEGYTSFLWVTILRGVWEVFGIEPPQAVGPLSLLLGIGSLGLAARLVLRLPLSQRAADSGQDAAERLLPWFVAAALFGIVANRTYLAWMSSGLETALFNFSFTAWVVLCIERGRAGLRLGPAVALATAAAASALTRPDGWLAVAGTFALLAIERLQRGRFEVRELLGFSPLALPFAHLLWRHSVYGEWVPNTYFAKHLGAWPESGLRYAASFVLEYAVWIWLLAVLYWVVRETRDLALATRLKEPGWTGAWVGIGGLGVHFAYYTLSVGGDHFEYRVYSHLIPLLFVSFPWLLLRAGLRPSLTLAALVSFVGLSLPIPWAHHLATRDLVSREETHRLVQPVEDLLPAPLSMLAAPFDELQAWLIPHHVAMRHREHVAFLDFRRERLPSRQEGARIGWESHPVVVSGNVGWLGWVLPNVAILDPAGLNDYVVARTTPPEGRERKMAHDRVAHLGYLACFQPNVLESKTGIQIIERAKPLTDADIVRCEKTFRPIAHTLQARARNR